MWVLSFKKLIIVFFVIGFANNAASQNTKANSTIFNVFNSFFENEIKRQGVKGDWIFKLNEITSVNKFDFNNDGFIDVLIEFNAVPNEGGGTTNYYAVLFKNILDNEFVFVNYLNANNIKFHKFIFPVFVFNLQEPTNNTANSVEYYLNNGKFILEN